MRWPFMLVKTHERELRLANEAHAGREESYWKQFTHNTMWERKYNQARDEIEKLKKAINK